jgi:hypothetical protein
MADLSQAVSPRVAVEDNMRPYPIRWDEGQAGQGGASHTNRTGDANSDL